MENAVFGGLEIHSRLADDVVLSANPDSDLKLSLGFFAAECEAAGMRFSISNSEGMVLFSVERSQLRWFGYQTRMPPGCG